MADFNEFEQKLLRFLKDEYLQKGSRPSHLTAPATFHRDVMSQFGLDLPAYREVIGRFESLGIVEAPTITAHNGCLHIDPVIVDVVRQLDSPLASTTDGVVNVVNVHEMNQGVIQQGNVASTQNVSFTEIELEGLAELVAEVRAKLPELQLQGDDSQVAAEDIGTIEQQIRSPRPKRNVIKECLTSLRAIAEGAAGEASGAGIVAAITTFLNSL